MPALLYGLEAWGKMSKDEMNEHSRESIEKDIQLANISIIYWLNNGNRYMAS